MPLPDAFLGLPPWTRPLPPSSAGLNLWDGEFEHEVLTVKPGPGSAYQDAAFVHKPSRTLLVCDAVFAATSEPPPILTSEPEYTRALLFHARDDPLVSHDDCYDWPELVRNPRVVVVRTNRGGHNAWHEGFWPLGPSWAVGVATDYVSAVLEQTAQTGWLLAVLGTLGDAAARPRAADIARRAEAKFVEQLGGSLRAGRGALEEAAMPSAEAVAARLRGEREHLSSRRARRLVETESLEDLRADWREWLDGYEKRSAACQKLRVEASRLGGDGARVGAPGAAGGGDAAARPPALLDPASGEPLVQDDV